MTDREIIELFFNENGRVGSTKLKDTWLEKHPGVKEYLLNRYSDIDENTSLSEILYRIKNNKSKPEEHCYELLSKIFKNIKRQYQSK